MFAACFCSDWKVREGCVVGSDYVKVTVLRFTSVSCWWFESFSQGTVCTRGLSRKSQEWVWARGQIDRKHRTSTRVLRYYNWLLDCRKNVIHKFDYLEDVIVEAADDLKNSCSYYPGIDQLMKVDYDSPSLSPKNAKLFHQYVARLLFASKRVRPGIQVCCILMHTCEITKQTRLQETWESY